jgi:hypothetical protein
MIRPIMYVACNAFYGAGHVWSRVVLRFDCMFWTYQVYNWLMGVSYAINERYEFKVWL